LIAHEIFLKKYIVARLEKRDSQAMTIRKKIRIVLLASLFMGPQVAHSEEFDLLSADRVGVEAPQDIPASIDKSSVPQKNISQSQILSGFQPKDLVRVSVYGEPDLSKTYQVDDLGKIYIPLIGAVKAIGQSREGLENDIRQRLKKGYLLKPKVTVDVPSWPCAEKP
jgi:hypothetical protein